MQSLTLIIHLVVVIKKAQKINGIAIFVQKWFRDEVRGGRNPIKQKVGPMNVAKLARV